MSNEPVYQIHTLPLRKDERAALKEGDAIIVKGRYQSVPAKVVKVTNANVTVLEAGAKTPRVFNISNGYERGKSRDRWASYTTLHPSAPGIIQATMAEKAVLNVDNRSESLALRVRKLRQLARDGYVSIDDAAAIESAFNGLYALVSAHIPEGVKF